MNEKNLFKKITNTAEIAAAVTIMAASSTPKESTAQNVNNRLNVNPDTVKNIIYTPRGQELMAKYVYTMPDKKEYQDVPDKYWDKILDEKLIGEEKLTNKEAHDLIDYIQNPTYKIPPTISSREDPKRSDVLDPSQMDLYTGDEDRANIERYRPDKNLKARMRHESDDPNAL